MRFLFAVALLSGCHGRIRFASPQIQHAPEVTCIVIIQGENVTTETIKVAVDVCRDAVKKGGLNP